MPKCKAIISLLAVGAFLVCGVAYSWEKGACERDTLDGKKLWISSAVWADRQEKVLLIDSVRNSLLLYSPVDQEFSSISDPGTKKPYPFPASLKKHEMGYVLNLLDSKMVLLGQDLHPLGVRQLLGQSGNVKKGIGSVYDWTVTNNRNMFAYGAVLNGGPNFTMGFFRAPLDSPASAEMVLPFDRYIYYTLGYPYIVTIENDAYFLEMDREVVLFRASGASKKPEALGISLPRRFRSAPDFKTQITGPGSAANLYKELEHFSTPVGLYSHGKFLYLLVRAPDKVGGTAWWLYQIDPSGKGGLRGRLRLPTASNHLTIVPASDYWLIFERGPVIAMGDQDLRAALRVPASWITEPSKSPLQRTASTAELCK